MIRTNALLLRDSTRVQILHGENREVTQIILYLNRDVGLSFSIIEQGGCHIVIHYLLAFVITCASFGLEVGRDLVRLLLVDSIELVSCYVIHWEN